MPSSSRDLAFAWRGLSLAGTLHVPSGDGPFGAVAMFQGSGPADRNGEGYFDEIRRAFLTRQIVTFAFDKPGCGDSTGDWRDHGLEDRASQAAAALGVMRDQFEVDAGAVGIWGQSQGGWLVQLLASRMPDLAFAIANSGPTINVVDQNLYGTEHSLRAAGYGEPDIAEALGVLRALHAAALDGTDFATVDADVLRPVRETPWFRDNALMEDAADWRLLQSLVGESFEPLDALRQVRCPFLAIYGGLDLLLPAWRGAEETGRALHEAGNDDSTVTVFPGGDHRIKNSTTGQFVIGYLDVLADWTARRVSG